MPLDTRTKKQNSALHLYFEMLASILNEAGLEMKVVLKPEIDIWWTAYNIKEYLWRPIQKLQVGKKSTTELDKKEVSDIYDTLHRHLSEKFGKLIEFPQFPSLESLIEQDEKRIQNKRKSRKGSPETEQEVG